MAPETRPPAVWSAAVAYARRMARYVVDAVTLLHVVDHGLDVDPAHRLVAPNAVRTQVLQLLLSEVRNGTRSDAAALQVHETITALKLRLLGDRVSRGLAWRIAREHDWADLSDAEYVALARLQADALVTVAPGLTARAEGVVPLAPVQALASR
jgi:hypothetical protein